MPNWEKIRKEWETSKITFKALAEKHGIKDSTIRSRKNREKWQRNDATQHTTKKQNVATKQNDEQPVRKRGAPKGNKNAEGNRGNKNASPPKRNSNAVTHGFFAKYLPEETLEIMQEIEERSPIDMLWENIMIQYTAIIRAQRVMWVDDSYSHLKKLSGSSWMDGGGSDSYKVSFAYEQYHSFLSAQSRAMAELRNMIKQYDELLKTDMATEEQKARIAVLKSKVPNQNTTDMNKQIVALADLINNPAPDRVIEDD